MYFLNANKCGYTFGRCANLSNVSQVHRGIEGVYVLNGDLQTVIDGKKYHLRGGDICMVLPLHRHSFTTASQSDTFCFALLEENLLMMDTIFSGNYDFVKPIFRREMYPEMVNQIVNLLLLPETKMLNAMSHVGLLNTLVGLLIEANPLHEVDYLQLSVENRALLYLHDHECEPITLTQAAEDLGISQFKLSRICKEELGINFNTYMKTMRIASAKRRLAFSGLSVSQIAEDLGFESLRTFNRAFSEETGMTPRLYRNYHKNKTSMDYNPKKEERMKSTKMN